MRETEGLGYYTPRSAKLLKDFDRTAILIKDFTLDMYGSDLADELYRDARKEYEGIIPQIPYIEGAQARALNSFLLITAQEVAVYKAMKKYGKTLEETWEVCHEAIKLRMKKFPKWKAWFLRKMMYSNFFRKRIKKRAENNEHLKFGDFEVAYHIGDGKEFDYGVDYLKCGNYNLAIALGAEEFAPYVCMSDIPLGDAIGWGLTRTQTLADGCEYCDFRFKKESENEISSKTPEVQRTIDKIMKKVEKKEKN
jgi:hypothetical protein